MSAPSGAGEVPDASAIRIVIADDHRMARAGLKMLLQLEPDIDVVGEDAANTELARKELMTKLGFRGMVDVTRFVRERGLLSE